MQKPQAPNPLVPKLISPEASQVARAVIEARPMIQRMELLDLVAPHQRKIIEAIGNCDVHGNPLIEFENALHMITIINLCRKVWELNDPVLTKAQGAESAHFLHFSKLSGVKFE
jgi:hypothetical protein